MPYLTMTVNCSDNKEVKNLHSCQGRCDLYLKPNGKIVKHLNN